MIVVPILLYAAVKGGVHNLGTLVIDNIGGTRSRGDYRVRVYAKDADIATAKPFREGRVLAHRRLAEPVGNLIAKALKETGYG